MRLCRNTRFCLRDRLERFTFRFGAIVWAIISGQNYILGRIFGVLESIQSAANPGLSSTIKDRYSNAPFAQIGNGTKSLP